MANRTKTVRVIVTLVILAVLCVVVVLQLKSNKKATEDRVYQYDKSTPVSVTAETVSRETTDRSYTISGTFEPNKETKISAEVQGKIIAVLVDVGTNVSKGQNLIQLDNSLLKLQLQSLDIQIEGLESDVARYTVLAKAEAVQGIQLEKAELGLKAAKIQRATLVEQINKTSISAPFAGIVTAKLSEEGAFAAPGVPLLQITDISSLKFTINVPEFELPNFAENKVFELTADSYPEMILNGKISLIGSKANAGNSFPVQFSVQNTADLKLKSGMFGKLSVNVEQKSAQISIPARAIVGTTEQPQVYVAKNGKAVLQNITVSERYGNRATVSSGLSGGELLITNGFLNLFDGANISIKN